MGGLFLGPPSVDMSVLSLAARHREISERRVCWRREEKEKDLLKQQRKLTASKRFMRTAREFNYTVKVTHTHTHTHTIIVCFIIVWRLSLKGTFSHETRWLSVLGLGEEWKGGDVARTVGGGQKVRWLKKELLKLSDNKDMVVMFVPTGSYDVIFASGPEELLAKFSRLGHRVVFSAEGFCWPDQRLASKYPQVHAGKRYLNSGGFIGFASDLSVIVQQFYTKIYLETKFNMTLDHRSRIFQNLNGAVDEVVLKFERAKVRARNVSLAPTTHFLLLSTATDPPRSATNPVVPPASCDSTRPVAVLNTVRTFLHTELCVSPVCIFTDEEMPLVYVAVFIEHATPFMEEFLDRLTTLNYCPTERIRLFIHNNVVYHEQHIHRFWDRYRAVFPDAVLVGPEENLKENKARNMAVTDVIFTSDLLAFGFQSAASQRNKQIKVTLQATACFLLCNTEACKKDPECDYYFSIDSDVALTNPDTLRILIEENNCGLWNVPYITQAYLIRGSVLRSKLSQVSLYVDEEMDPDMVFCRSIRDQGVFMFVSNRDDFGRLVASNNFNTSRLHPDMWQIFDNPVDWKEKYIHENYTKIFEDEKTFVEQPCPDVYWFPAFSDKMCDHLVETMEDYGEWSGGRHKRLSGGYENVPTVDIHMNQIGFEKEWLKFLKEFIVPVTEKLYPGYYPKAQAIMNFVVRYRPDEQPSLRPHHDSSTFTINIALNRKGIDFRGWRLQVSCVMTVRWSLPGKAGPSCTPHCRLTHYHEGLPTTRGTLPATSWCPSWTLR
ncbi:hypothetical protein L3Q82_016396, partial [Scortum barcoo]